VIQAQHVRGGGALVALAIVALLMGCGEPPRQKGPALPYNPEPAPKSWSEKDFKLRDDLPKVLLKTTQGEIEVTLFEDEAPNTVANFITLVEQKFYDGLSFHRVVPDFCVQGGDPQGNGSGGPGYRLPPEFPDMYHKNEYGTLATAKNPRYREMSGSQFYFNIKKGEEGNKQLDRQHVVFGKVSRGIEAVEKLAAVKVAGEKPVEPQLILSATVLNKRNHEYKVTGKVPAEDELKKSGEDKTGAAKSEAKTDAVKTEAKPEMKTEAKTEAKSDVAKTAAPEETKTK